MATVGSKNSSEKPLRLWPGVAGAIIVVFARFVIAPFVPGAGVIGLLVGAAGAALILLWWLFFSRAPWLERIGAVLLIALAAVVTRRFAHPSIGGDRGEGCCSCCCFPRPSRHSWSRGASCPGDPRAGFDGRRSPRRFSWAAACGSSCAPTA